MSDCRACGAPLGGLPACPACGVPATTRPISLTEPAGASAPVLLTKGHAPAPAPTPVPPAPRTDAPAAPADRRRLWLILGIAALLVVAASGGATALLLNRSSPEATSQRAASTAGNSGLEQVSAPVSFRSGPNSDWVVTPSDFLDGKEGTFYGVGYFAPASEPPSTGAAEVGDDSITIAVAPSADSQEDPQEDPQEGGRILGLDPASGAQQWSIAMSSITPTCLDLSTQGQVACVDDRLVLADPATGKVKTLDLDLAYDDGPGVIVDGPGDAFYTLEWDLLWDDAAGTASLNAVNVTKWTPDGPEWSKQVGADPAHGALQAVHSDATSSRLALDLDGQQFLIDAADGALLKTGDNSEGAETNHFGLADPTTTDLSGGNPSTTSSDGITLEANTLDRTLTARDESEDTIWTRTLPDVESMASEAEIDYLGAVGVGFARDGVVFSSELLIEGFTGFGSGSAPDPDDVTQYRTPCGKEPQITPVSAAGADGTIEVTLEFHAVCPGGQYVDGSAVALSFLGADDTTFGDAVFDFSQAPLWLPAPKDGDEAGPAVTTTVSLPPGSAFATSDELESAIDTITVQCDDSAGSSGDDVAPGDGEDVGTGTLYTPYAPSTDDRTQQNADALAALKRIAASDQPAVNGDLEGSWVPQLSSKKDGTTDRIDQQTYDYADILAEHLRLRETYPDVRLLFSSNWKSFLLPDFWVTVVGQPEPAFEPVLAFCEQEGFPVSHCFAKRILVDGPQKDSTRSRA